MQRIIFSGTRRGAPQSLIEKLLTPYYQADVLIVEGGATGVDAQVRTTCKAWGINVWTAWGNWTGLGYKAGPIRNQLMLDVIRPNKVYLLPDSRSKGTIDMYKRVQKAGYLYEIHTVEAN